MIGALEDLHFTKKINVFFVLFSNLKCFVRHWREKAPSKFRFSRRTGYGITSSSKKKPPRLFEATLLLQTTPSRSQTDSSYNRYFAEC